MSAGEQRSGEHAFVFRLSGFEFELDPEVRFQGPGAITLSADQAVLEGRQLRRETRGERTNIGFWDTPNERVHLVDLPAAHALDPGLSAV